MAQAARSGPRKSVFIQRGKLYSTGNESLETNASELGVPCNEKSHNQKRADLETSRRLSLTFSHNHGMPDWIRTNDLLLRKQTLYPTELRARVWIFQQIASYPPEMKMNITLRVTLILYHIYKFMNRENR